MPRSELKRNNLISDFFTLMETTKSLIVANKAVVESNKQLQQTVVDLSERVFQLEQTSLEKFSREGKTHLPPDLYISKITAFIVKLIFH